MKRQFLLPDPGEGLLEAEIVSWRVEAGQEGEVNDVLVEIETAKSLVELPSPFAGTVSSLLVPEGAAVEVGTAIVEIDDGTEGEEPNLVGYGPRDEPVASRRRRRAAAEPEPAPEASAEPPGPRAKPPVRKYARDLGVDLSGHRLGEIAVGGHRRTASGRPQDGRSPRVQGRRGSPHPHQGGAQGHGRGDGALRHHPRPRHRVADL